MIATPPVKRSDVWRRVGGVIRLLRPVNMLILLVGVAAGAALASHGELRPTALVEVGLAALSAMLIGGAANSMNDVFDLEIDRINRPQRPLPAELVSPGTARILWAFGSAIGIGLSFWLSLAHAILAIGAVVSLHLYNLYWKRTVLTGNVVVAGMTGLALVYGAWAVGESGPVLVGAAFAFLTTLAREIIKDIEDLEGDKAGSARTVAVAWGARRAALVAANVLAGTVILTPFPYLLLGYGGSYLFVIVLADAAMLYAMWCLQRPNHVRYARRASGAVKWAMVIGIVALAVATVA